MRDRNIVKRPLLPVADVRAEPASSVIDQPFLVDYSRLDHLKTMVVVALRESRIEANLSQDEIAFRLGWRRTSYVQRERGKPRVSVHEVFPLALVLNMTAAQFLNRVLLLYSQPSSRILPMDRVTQVAKKEGRIKTWRAFRASGAPRPAVVLKLPSLDRLKRATAAVIRDTRRRLNLSDIDFAQHMRWPLELVQRVEKTYRSVYIYELILMSPVLQLTPRQLLTDIEERGT